MKLIPDAMAQAEQPATPATPTPPAAPTPPATQTGTAAPGQPDANQPPSLPDLMAQLVPIFVVMGIVYILVIRPRARREKEQQSALRNVRRGDTLVTTGGIVGKVTKSIDDSEVEIEIAQNVRIRLLRSAIVEIRAKGEPVKEQQPAAAKPAPEPKPKPASESKTKS